MRIKNPRDHGLVVARGGAVDPTTLALGTTGQVLTATTGADPSFAAPALVNLTTGVTGVLPVANGGTGQAVGVLAPLWLGGTAVAPGTVFLGLVGEDVTEANAQWAAPFSGAILRMYVTTSGPPVGAESFAYRPRINGVVALSSGLSLTGTATTGNIAGSAAIALGDLLSVRLIVSAGAAVVNHQVSLLMRVDG